MSEDSQKITTEAEKFKASPLGFLMAVIAKYEAFLKKQAEASGDGDQAQKAKRAGEILDDIKIEISRTDNLKKESSNEAVLMHVVEKFSKEEQDFILECIFEYLNLLDGAMGNIDSSSADGIELAHEYYDVSRLGLILNCYLGGFDNEDFFYGTLAEMAECSKAEFCDDLVGKIQKADIDLKFADFMKDYCEGLDERARKFFYESMIVAYGESLLNKVLTQETDEETVSKLACAKQIQRIYEKL